MDDQRVGRVLRALRHRLRWRQVDVARRAGLTQDDVSRAERGQMHDTSKLRRHAAALDAEVYVGIRWRGGEVDRLLDEGHAAIVGWITKLLVTSGWEVIPEASFSVHSERGSIDVLAWHRAARILLVVEVKTELTSIEETLRKHDVKQRLAPLIGEQRFGSLAPAAVARLLVLPDSTTARRQVDRHEPVLTAAYPLRSSKARLWLAKPDGAASGLIFAPVTRQLRVGCSPVSRKRIRATGPRSVRAA